MEKEEYQDNIILEVLTGSHLYGTNNENSDKDYLGVFLPPKKYVLGLKTVKEVSAGIESKDESGKNTKEALDRKFYEFRNFVNLAIGSNPNIMEILFVPEGNIVSINDFGKDLLNKRDMFLSKQCIPKFLGYARSQKHKLFIKREKLDELEEGLDILKRYDNKQVLAEVEDVQVPLYPFHKKTNNKHVFLGDLCFEPGVYIKKAKKTIQERIDKFTNRKELIKEFGYDTKYAMHLIRLLYEGICLLKYEQLHFPLVINNFLKSIRKGDFSLEEIIDYSKKFEKDFEQAAECTNLRKLPDFNKIEKYCIDTLENFWYKDSIWEV